MLDRKEIRKFFHKPETIDFKGTKIPVWSRGYWIAQSILVALPFKMYNNRFAVMGWENVPENKPVLLAISHRNAFMDSLAFVNTKNTQVFQLARGDAFNKPLLAKLFYFFHMLPLWRERDGVDTKLMNQPTFDACADVLAKNGMVGIYPEGNCVNEEHIRSLKKGICRIAFMAEQRYNYELDVHIIPVGVNYSDAENFKKWQLINFGEPILLKNYTDLHHTNPALAINQLKEEIENGMKKVALHVEHSDHYKDIVGLSRMYGRYQVIEQGQLYTPESKFRAEQETVAKLEKFRTGDAEGMKQLSHDWHAYKKLLKQHHFRENTFDAAKQHPFSIFFMAVYFIFFSPVFLYGLIINFIPFRLPQKFVEKKVAQKIFWSSAKYVMGLILFPVYYLILTIIIWSWLGSLVSALVFLISFPISGNIAYYYYIDFKKWRSVRRFNRLKKSGDHLVQQMLALRSKIITQLSALS